MDDQVDEADDRRVPFLQGVGSGFAGPRAVLGEVDRGVAPFLEHRVDRLSLAAGAAVILIDRLKNRLFGGQRHLDLAIQDKPEFVDRLEIDGVVHDDLDAPRVLCERHHDILTRQ